MAKKNSGDQYAVDGAIYKCQYGGAPCQIAVTSNQTIMAQGKAIVTDKDVTFKIATSPFVNCMQNPNKQAPICNYANGVWTPNTTEPQGKKNAITESSKMKCPVFAGEISCVFPGQTQGVSAGDFDVKMEALCNFPFALQVTFPVNQGKKTQPQPQSIYSVSATKLGEKKRYKFKDSMYVRPNELITLYAYKKGNVELKATEFVNWAVSKRRKGIVQKQQKNKNQKPISEEKMFLDKLVLYKMTCSPFNLRFNEPGVYYVEGGSNGMVDGYKKINHKNPLEGTTNKIPKDEKCSLKVEVLDHNRIMEVRMEGESALNPKEKFKERIPIKESDSKFTYQSSLNSNKQADALKYSNYGADIPAKYKTDIKPQEYYFKQAGSYGSSTSYSEGTQKYTEVEVERYVHKSSDEIEFVVRTALPLKGKECFCILVNEYVHTDWNLKYSTDTEHHFSLKVPHFIPNIDITILMTEGLMMTLPSQIIMKPKIGESGVIDIKYLKVKQVNNIVFASVSLDNKGIEAVPPMVRPGTIIHLLVSPVNGYGMSNDLSNAEWRIEDKKIENKKSKGGKTQEEKKNVEEPIEKKYNEKFHGKYCMFSLKEEGEVTITLSLARCNDYLSNYNNGQEEYSRTLIIKRNAAIGIEDPRSVLYAGIQYRFKVKFYYDYIYAKDGVYKYKLDGKDQMNGTDEISLNIKEVGSHCLFFEKEKFNFEVCEPIIKTWQFADEYHNKVSKVGFDEKFYLEINIPAWKDLKNSKELLQNVRLFLWDTQKKTLIEKLTDDARFDENSKVWIELKITEDDVKLGGRKNIIINTSLMNPPYEGIVGFSRMEGLTRHWVSTKDDTSPLILTSEPEISGYFSGRSGNPLKSVMKYGDSIYIRLITHNYLNKMDRISVELWENNYKGDADRLFEVFTNDDERFNSDEYGKVKIDLSDLFKDEKAHGDNPNPRLFYFRVKLDEAVIYQYPQTQEDVFNMKFKKKRCESAVANDSQSVSSGADEQQPMQNDERTDTPQRPETHDDRNSNMPPQRQERDEDRNTEEPRQAMLNNERREEVHQQPIHDAPQSTDAPQQTAIPNDSQSVPSANASQQTEPEEPECDDSDTAVITQDDDVYTISKGDLSCDDNLKTKIRSYLWQLKVGKDKEVKRLNPTLAIVAPVVVGEELTKGEEGNENGCKCPRCMETAENMEKRLKKIFPKTKDAVAKEIAKAYCEFQYKLRMDSCWIKAVFFSNGVIESNIGRDGIPKTEGGSYTRKRLEDIKPSKIFKGDWNKKTGKWLSDTNKKGERIYKSDSIKAQLDDMFNKKDGEEKDKAIFSFMYAGENGNGNYESGDGWKYRGGSYTQITHKNAYSKVKKILESVGYENVGELNADSFEGNIRLAVAASMAFFKYKHGNMHALCDGVIKHDDINFDAPDSYEDVKLIENAFNVVGNDAKYESSFTDSKGGKVSFKMNHQGKMLFFKDVAYDAFQLKDCECNKVDVGTSGMITFHIYSNGRIEKHYPDDITDDEHYRYVYHPDSGEGYEVAVRKIQKNVPRFISCEEMNINQLTNAKKGLVEISGYYKPGVDGEHIYAHYDKNNEIDYVICDGHLDRKESKRKIYKYKSDKTKIELVRMDEVDESKGEHDQDGLLYFYQPGKVFIYYHIIMGGTQRYYADAIQFAAFIGILAHYGHSKLNSIPENFTPYTIETKEKNGKEETSSIFNDKYGRNGMGNTDIMGIGYPSVSHRQGLGFDYSYGTKEDDKILIEGAKMFGFRKRNLNCGFEQKHIRVGCYSIPGHETHIHMGPMKDSVVTLSEAEEDIMDSHGKSEIYREVNKKA